MGYEGVGSCDGGRTWGYALDFAMGYEYLTTPKPALLRVHAECHCNSQTEKSRLKHGHHFSLFTWAKTLSHTRDPADQPSKITPCMCQHEFHSTNEAFMHRNTPLDNTIPHQLSQKLFATRGGSCLLFDGSSFVISGAAFHLPPTGISSPDYEPAELETLPLAIIYCKNKIPYHVTKTTVETDAENIPKAWAAFQSPIISPRQRVTMPLYHGSEVLKAAHQYLEYMSTALTNSVCG